MIRPRQGDFSYAREEIRTMHRQIEKAADAGGSVFGALHKDSCKGNIEVVIGGGVNPSNVAQILRNLPLHGERISVHAFSGVKETGETAAEPSSPWSMPLNSGKSAPPNLPPVESPLTCSPPSALYL